MGSGTAGACSPRLGRLRGQLHQLHPRDLVDAGGKLVAVVDLNGVLELERNPPGS
jgi:hypothetical protein